MELGLWKKERALSWAQGWLGHWGRSGCGTAVVTGVCSCGGLKRGAILRRF